MKFRRPDALFLVLFSATMTKLPKLWHAGVSDGLLLLSLVCFHFESSIAHISRRDDVVAVEERCCQFVRRTEQS